DGRGRPGLGRAERLRVPLRGPRHAVLKAARTVVCGKAGVEVAGSAGVSKLSVPVEPLEQWVTQVQVEPAVHHRLLEPEEGELGVDDVTADRAGEGEVDEDRREELRPA